MIPERAINKIEGEVVEFYELGIFGVASVYRECPYCIYDAYEKKLHLVCYHRILNPIYTCPQCSVRYYFVGDNVYQYIPEAQLMYLPNYSKAPCRVDSIKTVASLYRRAVQWQWYMDTDLEITREIVDGKWTMPIEVAAQMYLKEQNGKAPGYVVAANLRDENVINPLIPSDEFRDSLEFLREGAYLKG